MPKVLWRSLIYLDNSWWEPLDLRSKQWKCKEIRHTRNGLKKELGILSFSLVFYFLLFCCYFFVQLWNFFTENIYLYCSCHSLPIWLEVLPSYHRFRVPSNYEVKCTYRTLELGHSNNPKDEDTKKRLVTKMFGSCPSKLDGEMFSLRFVF